MNARLIYRCGQQGTGPNEERYMKNPDYVNCNEDCGLRAEVYKEDRGVRMILRDTDACEVVGNKLFTHKPFDEVKQYADLCLCFEY